MKLPLLLSLVAAAATVAGCSTTHSHTAAPSTAAAPASSFDTSALVAAFKNADLSSTQTVQSVVSALSSKDYSGALSSLQKLSRIPGLTAPQSDAVHQLIASVSAKAK